MESPNLRHIYEKLEEILVRLPGSPRKVGEDEPHSADFLRGYNEGCKDGAENTLREIIARNAERKAQASSEIREERLQELDGVEKHLTQHPYGYSARQWIRERRDLLAPSRQGAGGK